LPQIPVIRKPRVAIVATGDELSRPGEARKEGGIVASSTYALQAMVRGWGGAAFDLSILADKPEAFADFARGNERRRSHRDARRRVGRRS